MKLIYKSYMWALAKVIFLVQFLILSLITSTVFANEYDGSCFRIRFKDSKCGPLLMSGISRERCCKSHYRRAWSPSGTVINNTIPLVGHADEEEITNQILGKRSTSCIPCYASCQEIRCDEDQKCVMRHGLPKCVCNPKCHLQHKSAVCGTDGRTYVSECHLLKRSCRKRQKLLVAHSGPCQTCSGVRCGSKKTCVLDELLTPECTKCPKSCLDTSMRRSICGTDDVTYPSKCALKLASCKAGMTIKKAYKGPCKKDAECSNVKCWQDETCLLEPVSGRPRCTNCGDLQGCPSTARFICASDGSTFQSWCAFKHTSCRAKKALLVVPLRYCSSNSTKIAFVENYHTEDCSSRYKENTKYNKVMKVKLHNKSKLKQKRNMKKLQNSQSSQLGPLPNLSAETSLKANERKTKSSKKLNKRKKKNGGKEC